MVIGQKMLAIEVTIISSSSKLADIKKRQACSQVLERGCSQWTLDGLGFLDGLRHGKLYGSDNMVCGPWPLNRPHCLEILQKTTEEQKHNRTVFNIQFPLSLQCNTKHMFKSTHFCQSKMRKFDDSVNFKTCQKILKTVSDFSYNSGSQDVVYSHFNRI